MKKNICGFFILLVAGCVLSAQDYSIATEETENIDDSVTVTRTITLVKPAEDAPLPWFTVEFTDRVNSYTDAHEKQFWFNYAGNRWRYYDKAAFNIDGAVFYCSLRGKRQEIGGGVFSEINCTDVTGEMLDALKNANAVKFQTSGTDWTDKIIVLSVDAVESLKQLLYF